MTDDALARLKAALSSRYTIERELGAGCMPTVYLAEDLKHRRNAAVKVLHPELTAALNADRFLPIHCVAQNLFRLRPHPQRSVNYRLLRNPSFR